jgi:uncharacterized protein (TIGR00369 family)
LEATEVRIWEEPVRGVFGDLSTLALSGVDRMRRTNGRRFVPPPIHHLTGLTPTESSLGTSTFTMPASPWLQTTVPDLMPGGALAFLADGPLGTAIITLLPPLGYMTTSDLSLSFLRPATVDSGTLIGRARVIHGGRSVALSEVTIEDSQGRYLAHGTSRGFVLTAPGAPEAEAREAVHHDTPDPYLRRPVAGSPIAPERWERITGLEAMRGCIAFETVPPIYHLTGLHPVEAGEGTCTFAMPASPWLCSPQRVLYGGAIALMADAALSSAVMTTVPAGWSFASLDLKVSYLRPVAPDGRMLRGRAKLVHRGRTMALAEVEVFNEDDKKVAVGTSSSILINRPWSELTSAADGEIANPDAG